MSEDDTDDLRKLFLDHVAAFESVEPRPLFDVLPETGISLPPPDSLDDAQLSRKLKEVIHALALLGNYLLSTDHLSDRELYTELWDDALREEAVLMPENPDFAGHIDMVGSGSEEHTNLFLKYYASEEERQSWLADWPDEAIPDHEDPPYDRDRFLPKAEFRKDGLVM